MPSSDLNKNKILKPKKVIIKLIEKKKKPKPIEKPQLEKKPEAKKEEPKKKKQPKKAKLKTKKIKAKTVAKKEPPKPKKIIKPKAFSVDLEATIDMGGVAVTAVEGGGNVIADGTDIKSDPGKKKDNKIPDPEPVEEIEYVTKMPRLISKPNEATLKKYYPEKAREEGLEQDVRLEILVSTNGKVIKVKVLDRVDKDFEKAARKLIKKFKFRPAQKNNKSVAVWIQWTYKFRLDG